MPIKTPFTALFSLAIRAVSASGFATKFGPRPENHSDSSRSRHVSGFCLAGSILPFILGRNESWRQ